MKLMAALALACGVAASPMMAAGTASALPSTCDGVDCVPYLQRNINPADYCSFSSRHPFGLDAAGNTYACAATNQWVSVPPLVGVRTLRAPCDESVPGSAQSPGGQPLICQGQAWSTNFTVLYYS